MYLLLANIIILIITVNRGLKTTSALNSCSNVFQIIIMVGDITFYNYGKNQDEIIMALGKCL